MIDVDETQVVDVMDDLLLQEKDWSAKRSHRAWKLKPRAIPKRGMSHGRCCIWTPRILGVQMQSSRRTFHTHRYDKRVPWMLVVEGMNPSPSECTKAIERCRPARYDK